MWRATAFGVRDGRVALWHATLSDPLTYSLSDDNSFSRALRRRRSVSERLPLSTKGYALAARAQTAADDLFFVACHMRDPSNFFTCKEF